MPPERRRPLALDLDLNNVLLEESASDVLALKRAWEIDWRDVHLTVRIDQGAEGAFGEVGSVSPTPFSSTHVLAQLLDMCRPPAFVRSGAGLGTAWRWS